MQARPDVDGYGETVLDEMAATTGRAYRRFEQDHVCVSYYQAIILSVGTIAELLHLAGIG